MSTTNNKDGDYCMRNTYVNNNNKDGWSNFASVFQGHLMSVVLKLDWIIVSFSFVMFFFIVCCCWHRCSSYNNPHLYCCWHRCSSYNNPHLYLPMSTTTTNKDGDYCMRNTYVNNNKQIKMGIIVWGTPMSTTTTIIPIFIVCCWHRCSSYNNPIFICLLLLT
jgi:hypothetical protein